MPKLRMFKRNGKLEKEFSLSEADFFAFEESFINERSAKRLVPSNRLIDVISDFEGHLRSLETRSGESLEIHGVEVEICKYLGGLGIRGSSALIVGEILKDGYGASEFYFERADSSHLSGHSPYRKAS